MNKGQKYRDRRLQNELKHFSNDVAKEYKGDLLHKIIIKTPHERKITFEIPEEYPFKPPKIYINNIDFHNFPIDPMIQKIFVRNFQLCPCPCCIIDLKSKWSPCVTLQSIYMIYIDFEIMWMKAAQQYIDQYLLFSKDISSKIAVFF